MGLPFHPLTPHGLRVSLLSGPPVRSQDRRAFLPVVWGERSGKGCLVFISQGATLQTPSFRASAPSPEPRLCVKPWLPRPLGSAESLKVAVSCPTCGSGLSSRLPVQAPGPLRFLWEETVGGWGPRFYFCFVHYCYYFMQRGADGGADVRDALGGIGRGKYWDCEHPQRKTCFCKRPVSG